MLCTLCPAFEQRFHTVYPALSTPYSWPNASPREDVRSYTRCARNACDITMKNGVLGLRIAKRADGNRAVSGEGVVIRLWAVGRRL